MKCHISIAQDGNLKWLACRTSINAEIDSVDLNDVLQAGIPPALDCATCKKWLAREARQRRTKLRKWQ